VGLSGRGRNTDHDSSVALRLRTCELLGKSNAESMLIRCMMWNVERGWGLYVVIFGVIALSGVLFAETTSQIVFSALVGLALVYHGVAMARSRSHAP